ncbi:unnamed protein product [Phytophthora fragariaefolia]|uniref:Unnamed protein product n=1 Tax=Phytophthora fragariaefolia TaxID=1490495 RepID=A0A9W7D270_9STRA|nr:unnamed protein product [Phytophthora fragariaefolia]
MAAIWLIWSTVTPVLLWRLRNEYVFKDMRTSVDDTASIVWVAGAFQVLAVASGWKAHPATATRIKVHCLEVCHRIMMSTTTTTAPMKLDMWMIRYRISKLQGPMKYGGWLAYSLEDENVWKLCAAGSLLLDSHETRSNTTTYFLNQVLAVIVKKTDPTKILLQLESLESAQHQKTATPSTDDTLDKFFAVPWVKPLRSSLTAAKFLAKTKTSTRPDSSRLLEHVGDKFDAYGAANQKFLEAVGEIYRDGDLVLVCDYELMALPGLLRRRFPDITCGFYFHCPFPSSEFFQMLPERDALLHGVLGADLVVFNHFDYVRHFRNVCTRMLGLESSPSRLEYNGRLISLGICPMGIDPAKYAITPKVEAHVEMLKRQQDGMKIIVGVHKLDFCKGIPEMLEAMEYLLQHYPEYRGKVVLYAVVRDAGRTASLQYRMLSRQINELVGRVNGRFGTAEYCPVRYLKQSIDHDQLVALYNCADVAIVSSIKEGINLQAMEFIAAQKKNCHGEWFGHLPRVGLAAEHGYWFRPASKHPSTLEIDLNNGDNLPRQSIEELPHALESMSMAAASEDDPLANSSSCVMGGSESAVFERAPWQCMFSDVELEWRDEVESILEHFTERTPGSLLDVKDCCYTWHFRDADPTFGLKQAKDMQLHFDQMLRDLPVGVVMCRIKKYVTVRPWRVNKGRAVSRILEYESETPYFTALDFDFILALGDERTDEDMFDVVQGSNCYTCTVGMKVSRAQYYLEDPDEVLRVLTACTSLLGVERQPLSS